MRLITDILAHVEESKCGRLIIKSLKPMANYSAGGTSTLRNSAKAFEHLNIRASDWTARLKRQSTFVLTDLLI